MAKRSLRLALASALLAFLGACGGGGDGSGADPATADAASAPVIGNAGGTATHASGASVIVPAGAIDSATTIRLAMDSSGAPALPRGVGAAGNTYVVTPHGGDFAQPVEVRIPASAAGLLPNQELKLAKAQPGGAWELLDSVLKDGVLSAQVHSFSYFMPVVITYVLPLATAEPWKVVSAIDCGGQPCDRLVGDATVTVTWTTNGGQLPAMCVGTDNAILIGTRGLGEPAISFPVASGSHTRTFTMSYTGYQQFSVFLACDGHLATSSFHDFFWQSATYPNLAVLRMPAQRDVVQGLSARLDAVLTGGASKRSGGVFAVPTSANRASVDWQRSDDNGASWRPVARSYQDEAKPDGLGAPEAWRYWQVSHGFTASLLDQGALIRVHACYTPPDVPAPPCVTGPATRLNVLQLSALPAIVDAPRSLLVKSGQTASFSATAQGAPAPTLRWQTRAANTSGAWSDVSAGAGATTGNYTTPVLGTAANGTQYRVVASNALGSAESAAVTVSVSDLDVAPTITTQPAALSLAAGSDAAFAIAARGTEALSYQWTLNGVAIVGANGPVLRLPAVNAGQAGAYRATVSNAAGSALSDVATLSVGAAAGGSVAPTIVTQPVSVHVNAGNTATFAVGASGSGSLAYQWLKNGAPIAGATAAFHSIAAAAIGDAGTYSVQVSNGVAPTATSFNVVLVVNASAAPTPVSLQTQPSPQVQAPGGSATFAVAASGSGPIAYQWLKNGAPIAGATGAVLLLTNVSGSDAASYAVTVSNPLATLSSNPAALVVLGAPLIDTGPAAASATVGKNATFTVSASGSGLRHQWTRNAVAIAGATASSYTTPVLTLADSGAVYGVVVYNGAGVAISAGAVLTVTPGPALSDATLVSVSTAGVVANNSSDRSSVSADGLVVAFTSTATNLVPGITVGDSHGYVRNLVTGVTTLVDQTPAGTPSSRGVIEMKLAANGRHVVFTSLADDLVAGDTNGSMDVFVRDLQTGYTTRANVLPGGVQMPNTGNASLSVHPTISANGEYVAFAYPYDLLGNGEPLAVNGVYLRDVEASSTRLAVASTSFYAGNPVLSNDASRIVYVYALGNQNVIGSYDVRSGTNSTLFTVDSTVFPQGVGGDFSLSATGRFVAFTIRSNAWIPGAAAAFNQVGVVDHLNPSVLTIASTGVNGIGDGHSGYAQISGDGRYVLFGSQSPGLAGDPAATVRTYLMVRDLVAATTAVASRRPNGTPVWTSGHGVHALSANGNVLTMVADRFDMTGDPGGAQVYAVPRP